MTRTEEQQATIELAGISIRTTNNEEAGPGGRIPGLWDAYFQSNILEHLDAANPHLIYGLYTDYESDANGAYTLLLGHEKGNSAPESLENYDQAVIPASRYLVFKTKKGPFHEVVPQAWIEIWTYFESSSIERAYTGDYELYDTRNFNPNEVEIEIYIAVK